MERNVYEFISKETKDPIVEWKTCKVSGQEFPIYQSDLEFYDKISPVINGVKYAIPAPTLCPEERQKRRLSFRNERKLYKRTCDATGKQIISIYSPDKPYKVYDQKYWWSDGRDPLEYGREYDFSKTFSQQFVELIVEVPKPSLHATECENSDYTNHSYYNKNCYYVFGAGYSEDCYYSDQLVYSKNCVECTISEKNTHCFQCVSCTNCSNCKYCNFCKDSIDCIACNDCVGCTSCIDCENLVNKQYYIANKEVGKEQYEEYLATAELKHHLSKTKKAVKISDSENCIGNEVYNSKNCVLVYDMYSSQGCKYVCSDSDSIDSFDCYGATKSPNSIECLSVLNGYSNIGNLFSLNSKYVMFSQFVDNCSNIFGCIGLRNKQYCIFNKQYTKEDYDILVPKIISKMVDDGERGEFFDPMLSPFGYNETIAQDNYPLTKEDALRKGYKRQELDYDTNIPANMSTLQGDTIPQDIHTVEDSILNAILICEVTGKPFRVQKSELEFYRKHNLPLPRKHPDQRHKERLQQLAPRQLFLRKCDHCGKEILSVYDKNYTGKVYCEACYNHEIYG